MILPGGTAQCPGLKGRWRFEGDDLVTRRENGWTGAWHAYAPGQSIKDRPNNIDKVVRVK